MFPSYTLVRSLHKFSGHMTHSQDGKSVPASGITVVDFPLGGKAVLFRAYVVAMRSLTVQHVPGHNDSNTHLFSLVLCTIAIFN